MTLTGLRSLARACHPGPTVAVTVLAALLAVSRDLEPTRTAVVGLAVLAGQLSIGWSNDLVDADRDRRVGRVDKPLATGELPVPVVRRATAGALLVCVVVSFFCGWWAGVVHVGLVVGSGWAYNLWLKRTALSFVPYAVAFGALPAFVTLSERPPVAPPWWLVAAGALLGVGAHFVNVLPDLADDAATGVRGLPHRLGGPGARRAAALVLLSGSVVSVFGPSVFGPGGVWGPGGAGGSVTGGVGGFVAGGSGPDPSVAGGSVPIWAYGGLAVAALLATVTLTGRGRAPFLAAIGIAAVDVVVLVLR